MTINIALPFLTGIVNPRDLCTSRLREPKGSEMACRWLRAAAGFLVLSRVTKFWRPTLSLFRSFRISANDFNLIKMHIKESRKFFTVTRAPFIYCSFAVTIIQKLSSFTDLLLAEREQKQRDRNNIQNIFLFLFNQLSYCILKYYKIWMMQLLKFTFWKTALNVSLLQQLNDIVDTME